MSVKNSPLIDAISGAKNTLKILGTIPLERELFRSGLLESVVAGGAGVEVLYESPTTLFHQSLLSDDDSFSDAWTYAELWDLRERALKRLARLPSTRVKASQLNVPMPFFAAIADADVFFYPVGRAVPDASLYRELPRRDRLRRHVVDFMDFFRDGRGANLLSTEADRDKLVVAYARTDPQAPTGFPEPRAILPRRSFTGTRFERQSVWLFVFNRQGDLLLQKRPPTAADNRGLWDKSVGGHVQPDDPTSTLAAARELAEELFIHGGEPTHFVKPDPEGHIINLGAWRPDKRGHEAIFSDLEYFGPDDWGYFHLPVAIARTSERRIEEGAARVRTVESRFITHSFLVVAPPGYIDSSSALDELERQSGAKYKTISVRTLRRQITARRKSYTDDLVYIMREFEPTLEQFAAMIASTPYKSRPERTPAQRRARRP